jgi:predicted cobalt transporter CbtA
VTTDLVRRVDPTRLRSLVLVAALLGLVAGLAGAAFATVAAEPAVDDAIAIEEEAAAEAPEGQGDDGHEEATVSREHQRGVGLFSAYALTGAAFGALLALATHGLRASREPFARVLTAGAVLAGAFTVAPWLKYPPNPPAVGDPDTLGERQRLYVTMIVATALVGFAVAVLARRLREGGWPTHRRVPVVAAAVAVPMLLLFGLLPGAPDPVPLPANLVWHFRLGSLGANLMLWTVLTLGLAYVVTEATRLLGERERDGEASPPEVLAG